MPPLCLLQQYPKMSSKDLVRSSFKYHLPLMKAFGLYPLDSWPEIYKAYGFFTYLFFTFITPCLTVTYVVVRGERSIQAISQHGFMMVELAFLTLKVLPCKINPEGTKRTLFNLNKKIFNSQLPEQDGILSEAVDNCRLVFQIYCTSVLFAISTWTWAPLFYKERRFPINLWLPFEPYENTTVYLSLYIFLIMCKTLIHFSGGTFRHFCHRMQTIIFFDINLMFFKGVLNAAVVNTAVDTLLVFLIYHAASQIRVLKDTLVKLGERAEDQVSEEGGSLESTEREEMKNGVIYRKICECIDHYDAIYE